MNSLSGIKKDLEFNKGLSSLIEVLKNLAVAQYRTLEHKMKTFEKLITSIEGFFEYIDLSYVQSPFVGDVKKPMAVVAVTSDSGLLGGLNMQVVTKAVNELAESPGKLIVVGERGKSYVRESTASFVAFPGIKDEERYSQAMQLRDYLIKRIKDGTYGQLRIVYPRPVTFTVQKVDVVTCLPFTPPKRKDESISQFSREVILESDLGDILEYLLGIWIGQKVYEIFGLSRLAEFAARYVHLEESLQKLKEMDAKQRLQYFRVRHEMIDRNMRELFSARLLYSN
jgi:ATP synthase F1 gamma subunit